MPCGVVVAITPFNFPLNLVCHKVGPALAAGNAVIVKPATDTPLSALKLTEILLEAGLPAEGIQCLTGPGGELGDLLCADPRVRKITFTGQPRRRRAHLPGRRDQAGDDGARLQRAGDRHAGRGPGQGRRGRRRAPGTRTRARCASRRSGSSPPGRIYSDFLDALKPRVEAITTGSQLEEQGQDGADGPREGGGAGRRVGPRGGGRGRPAGHGRRAARGAVYAPTIVADVKPDMRISAEELFGPAVAVTPFDDIDQAIALANDSPYGLSAAIFTESLESAMKFAREVQSGNLHINWGPQWRADLMPYGGLKESGFGKEGPAVRRRGDDRAEDGGAPPPRLGTRLVRSEPWAASGVAHGSALFFRFSCSSHREDLCSQRRQVSIHKR